MICGFINKDYNVEYEYKSIKQIDNKYSLCEYKGINCYLVSYEWNTNKCLKLIIPLQDRTFQKDIEKLSFSVV